MGTWPAAPLIEAQQVVISEIHYQPAGGTAFAEAEFIELLNSGNQSADLGGAVFKGGIAFTFPAGYRLAAGQRIVLCRNSPQFVARYGSVAQLMPGNYTGALNNSGETLLLTSASGAVLTEVRYGVTGEWPSRAAGQGSSLELVDPAGPQNLPTNWRASTEYHGSPGTAGTGPLNRVVINELLAHTDPPLEDAVELYNRTDTTLSVGGWYLSNSLDEPTRFRIPSGTTLPPRGFLVLYESQFYPATPEGDRVPFTFGAARGDAVVLTSADGAGRLLRFEDVQSFPASPNGVSFGRYPDGIGPFLLMSRMTLGTEVVNLDPPEWITLFRQGRGSSNAPHRIGPVVFNRIRYSAAAGEIEFVELLNISRSEVPLFDPFYPAHTWAIEGGITFQFPEPESLPPGGRIVVAGTSDFAAVRALLALPASVPVVGPYSGQLSAEGEELRLVRPDPPQQPPRSDAGFVPYYVVEKISYSALAPWPLLELSASQLIQRRVGDAAGYDAANWGAALVKAPQFVAQLKVLSASGGLLRLNLTGFPGSHYELESVEIAGGGTVLSQAIVASGIWATPPAVLADLGLVSIQIDLPLGNGLRLYRLRAR